MPRGLLAATAIATLLGTTLIVPTPSLAQDDVRARGNRACSGDARRICKDALEGGDMAVLACFQQNRARLSGNCRSFLVSVGQLN
jgi:hypothetical protein